MISDSQIFKIIFGFKIKHLRLQQNKSYQDLSNQTGLSTSYLSDIEKGKKYPKHDKIQLLAQSLNVGYDYLMSTRTDKKLRPIVELLQSDFFKFFPLEEFGISIEKLVDVFISEPHKINAFISTILKMIRNYQIDKEHFYRVALRSYQDMHDNYFATLEAAVRDFRQQFAVVKNRKNLSDQLLHILSTAYEIKWDKGKLSQNNNLKNFRSYYNHKTKILYLNSQLTQAQELFILAKEVGFQFLQLAERPYETELNKAVSFDKLLSNFKASYFAASLIMDENELVKDIEKITTKTTWKPEIITDLLTKYQVTPETLLQRLTNILPKHFGLHDLFFIRIVGGKELKDSKMTKELHLSQLHKPYQNETHEHLCQRWVSIKAMENLPKNSPNKWIVEAQISEYWKTEKAYFCFAIAQDSAFGNPQPVSVAIGIMMSEKTKATFNFLKDPQLKSLWVNTTCERCDMPNCTSRVYSPKVIEALDKEKRLDEELKKL